MKKIIIMAFVAIMTLSSSLYAQTPKFGTVDIQAILTELPEFKQAQKELEDLAQKWESQLSSMGEEMQKKYAEFQQQADSLPQEIAEVKYQELQQLQQRIQNFQQTAQQDMQTKQQQKMAPIIEKIRKTIKEVGAREGFTYIFQDTPEIFLYADEKAIIDVAPLIKTALGLK